ncbi:hypothetical protein HW555_005844 [Spodoptera exigua]|uniref:PPPDE domain-containing protein n=1 Tax=Spodoptera exigua TaxID=7107 RepID=A0A835GJ09_SPOEX|nr:hypothetical protein HW555_005844 [Spodoptera exigua]
MPLSCYCLRYVCGNVYLPVGNLCWNVVLDDCVGGVLFINDISGVELGNNTMADEQGTVVELYIYDLTNGLASILSPSILGRQIEGVWHTAVVVYDREFFYGGSGITSCAPFTSKHVFRSLRIATASTGASCVAVYRKCTVQNG